MLIEFPCVDIRLSSQKFLCLRVDMVTLKDVAVRIQTVKNFSSQIRIENLAQIILSRPKKIRHSRFIDSISWRI